MPKDWTRGLKNLEAIFCSHLALKHGFVKSIEEESDWGFTIKAHALVEAALNHLILIRFDEPKLHAIISKLGTSAEDLSKVAILKSLDLVSKEHRQFIRAFSRLRNAFAHDIKKIDSTLADYCDEDAKRARELREAIAPLMGDPKIGDSIMPKVDFIKQHLRLAVWVSALATVEHLIRNSETILDSRKARDAI